MWQNCDRTICTLRWVLFFKSGQIYKNDWKSNSSKCIFANWTILIRNIRRFKHITYNLAIQQSQERIIHYNFFERYLLLFVCNDWLTLWIAFVQGWKKSNTIKIKSDHYDCDAMLLDFMSLQHLPQTLATFSLWEIPYR